MSSTLRATWLIGALAVGCADVIGADFGDAHPVEAGGAGAFGAGAQAGAGGKGGSPGGTAGSPAGAGPGGGGAAPVGGGGSSSGSGGAVGGGGAGSSGAGSGGAVGGVGGTGAAGVGSGGGGEGGGGGMGGGGDGGTGGSGGFGSGGGGGMGGGSDGGTGGSGGGGVMNGPCTGNNQCVNGQICSNVNLQTEKITCATPNASAPGDLGATCSANSGCKSKFCDLAGSNTCLAGCNQSSDCAAGGAVCVQYLTSTPFTLCMKPCTKNEDCPANAGGTKTCMLHEDTVHDDLAFACDYLGATPATNTKVKTFPSEMAATDFCDTGVNLNTTQMMITKSYCSKTCATNADCGGTVLPNCKSINATKPSGGSTAFKACTP